jgi:hypothetical protein
MLRSPVESNVRRNPIGCGLRPSVEELVSARQGGFEADLDGRRSMKSAEARQARG